MYKCTINPWKPALGNRLITADLSATRAEVFFAIFVLVDCCMIWYHWPPPLGQSLLLWLQQRCFLLIHCHTPSPLLLSAFSGFSPWVLGPKALVSCWVELLPSFLRKLSSAYICRAFIAQVWSPASSSLSSTWLVFLPRCLSFECCKLSMTKAKSPLSKPLFLLVLSE